ncbi:MAG TPA: hypothetical protein VNA14_01040 [Mycobacteriales bacterium]|nr:hypothetical protein [Mycobacteriales bacterium]
MSAPGRSGGSGRDGGFEPAGLTRPTGADEHRRDLLARLPRQLAQLLTEPLGPLGLAGAAGPAECLDRDSRTAPLLKDFAHNRYDQPEWDFDR